jgi:FMN phosphatase YigB (HAD superfamily)
MRKIFIFDFDGTFYSGEHKFDMVKQNIDDNRRKFLSSLSDEQYKIICQENPRWINAVTGNDIVRCLRKLIKKYPNFDINTTDFYNWQNDFIYDIVLDYNQVVDATYLEKLCSEYSVYVVSNSSLKHIYHYMEKINVNVKWFKKVIGNEFKKEDPTKEHYYREIIEQEEAKPHNVYVFGDSVESDLTPAIHLGLNAFYVDNASNITKLVSKVINNEI